MVDSESREVAFRAKCKSLSVSRAEECVKQVVVAQLTASKPSQPAVLLLLLLAVDESIRAMKHSGWVDGRTDGWCERVDG